MKLDAAQIVACFNASFPRNQALDREIHFAIRVLCDAFNAAIDNALYSLDPSALERLGVLIAEHALRVRDLPRPSEMPDPVAEIEKRLDRAERLIEALIGPQTITSGELTFRGISGQRVVVTHQVDGQALVEALDSPEGQEVVRRIMERNRPPL